MHPDSTAIHAVLASTPMKIVAAYALPNRPLIDFVLIECLTWLLPDLMVSDLNWKHRDWKSELIRARGSL
jgi:hypothetical protein